MDSVYVRELEKAQSTETRSGMVVARGWGRGRHGQLVSLGVELQLEKMERFCAWTVVTAAQYTMTGLKATEPHVRND